MALAGHAALSGATTPSSTTRLQPSPDRNPFPGETPSTPARTAWARTSRMPTPTVSAIRWPNGSWRSARRSTRPPVEVRFDYYRQREEHCRPDRAWCRQVRLAHLLTAHRQRRFDDGRPFALRRHSPMTARRWTCGQCRRSVRSCRPRQAQHGCCPMADLICATVGSARQQAVTPTAVQPRTANGSTPRWTSWTAGPRTPPAESRTRRTGREHQGDKKAARLAPNLPEKLELQRKLRGWKPSAMKPGVPMTRPPRRGPAERRACSMKSSQRLQQQTELQNLFTMRWNCMSSEGETARWKPEMTEAGKVDLRSQDIASEKSAELLRLSRKSAPKAASSTSTG